MTVAEQRSVALEMANRKRTVLSGIKRDLRSGALSLSDAMADPPEVLLRTPLIDVLRWGRCQGRPYQPALVAIGKQAVRDGVNLMLPVGQASERSRLWVAEHGMWMWRPSQ